MKRQNKDMRKLHKENSGVAMIMALIVGVVVMAFSLSLILVTYTLYAQTNRKTTQLQCKYLAQSTAESLRLEFEDNNSDLYKYIQYKMGKNIGGEVWAPMNPTPEQAAALAGATPYTTLKLEVDAAGYTMYLSCRYKQGEVSADDTPDEPDDEDGEVDPGVGGTPAGGSGKNRLFVEIEAIRGSARDRDKQSYSMESEFLINAR